jgi:hypothetical protein
MCTAMKVFFSDGIKIYEMEVRLHTLLIRVLDEGGWTVLVPHITGKKKRTRYQCIGACLEQKLTLHLIKEKENI